MYRWWECWGLCDLIDVLDGGVLDGCIGGWNWEIDCFVGILIESLLDCVGDGNDSLIDVIFCGLICGLTDGDLGGLVGGFSDAVDFDGLVDGDFNGLVGVGFAGLIGGDFNGLVGGDFTGLVDVGFSGLGSNAFVLMLNCLPLFFVIIFLQ